VEATRLWKTPASCAGGSRRACWPAEKVEDTIDGGHGLAGVGRRREELCWRRRAAAKSAALGERRRTAAAPLP
jgi:hypothetical protein